jgi:glyoxylase-like metal-dependent hydrolase (beta-lactamase superfamily II)/rhodanese-related sulfurtransferase
MHVQQLYTKCLAHGAYYIESEGQAAIVDPLREPNSYLSLLKERGAALKYIFETHFHADFVSGHVDLQKATGAKIIYGPTAKASFDCEVAADGQIYPLGKLSIQVLHTPGHTMESSCFLLKDDMGHDKAVFTGDTLFLGDVGRPDLAQKAANLTQEELAGLLYDSIQIKLMPLADDLIIYPGHGAGSACGKNMMDVTTDTLGRQKELNYALKQESKEAFVYAVLDGITPPPGYFGFNVAMNKGGYDSFETVMERGMQALSVSEFELAMKEEGTVVLDTRSEHDFVKGFVPGSINIGLGGDFAPWVGAVIQDVKTPILLVGEDDKLEETITRLSRVGFDNIKGYLNDGFQAWMASGNKIDMIDRITAEQFVYEVDTNQDPVIDVRRIGEFNTFHLDDAIHKPLDQINTWYKQIDKSQHFYIHCAAGYRSIIATSFLQSKGFRNFTEVKGGVNAIKTLINSSI